MIMNALPKDRYGFLLPPIAPSTPYSISLEIISNIFDKKRYLGLQLIIDERDV
jgi:hypothetical protein